MATLALSPQTDREPTLRLYPKTSTLIRSDNTVHLVYGLGGSPVVSLNVILPWDSTISIDISSKKARKNILADIGSVLPANLEIARMTLIAAQFHARPDTLYAEFPPSDRMKSVELLEADTDIPLVSRLVERDAEHAFLRIEGQWEIEIPVQGDRDAFCEGTTVAIPVILNPGPNIVTVNMISGDEELLGSDTVSVFYSLSMDPESAPEDHVNEPFHSGTGNPSCSSCHADKVDEESSDTEMRCESCHQIQQEQHTVHALIEANDCATCHTVDPESGIGLSYDPVEENETCFMCHDALASAADEKSVVHPPFGGDVCTVCHSPHSSGNQRMIRKPVVELCVTCHDDKGENNHPVVFHPVRGKPDPRDETKELSCVSCHDPHASDNNTLLSFPGGYFAFCQSCHQK